MAETGCDTQETLPFPATRRSVRTTIQTLRDPALTLAAVAMILAAVVGIGPFAPSGGTATMIAHLDR